MSSVHSSDGTLVGKYFCQGWGNELTTNNGRMGNVSSCEYTWSQVFPATGSFALYVDLLTPLPVYCAVLSARAEKIRSKDRFFMLLGTVTVSTMPLISVSTVLHAI